jgi:hypothetical protein
VAVAVRVQEASRQVLSMLLWVHDCLLRVCPC